MWGLSWAQWVALLDVLSRPPVRASTLALTLLLGWAGYRLIPVQVPVNRLPDLWVANLGPVAAGLFLNLVATVAAVAYSLGAAGAALKAWDRAPAIVPFLHVLSGLAVLALDLYLAGRAVSWAGAACMLLGACGSIWAWARWSFASETSTYAGGSVYDNWQ